MNFDIRSDKNQADTLAPGLDSSVEEHLRRLVILQRTGLESVEQYQQMIECLRAVELATQGVELLLNRGPIRLAYELEELTYLQREMRDAAARQKYDEPIRFLKESEQILREGFRVDYENWMRGYLARGGQVTERIDHNFPVRDCVVAIRDLVLLPLHGAFAVNIIVPRGVRVLGGDPGDSNVYLMQGYERIGRRAGLYNDIDILP